MKKKLIFVMGSIILLVALTAGAFAANPIKLIVKGQKMMPTTSTNNPTEVLNQYSAAIPSYEGLSAQYDIHGKWVGRLLIRFWSGLCLCWSNSNKLGRLNQFVFN